MLFDPRLFNAIWLAIACMAIAVGLATMGSLIVSILTAIQVLRGKAERQPLIVEAYRRWPRQWRVEDEVVLGLACGRWPTEP